MNFMERCGDWNGGLVPERAVFRFRLAVSETDIALRKCHYALAECSENQIKSIKKLISG